MNLFVTCYPAQHQNSTPQPNPNPKSKPTTKSTSGVSFSLQSSSKKLNTEFNLPSQSHPNPPQSHPRNLPVPLSFPLPLPSRLPITSTALVSGLPTSLPSIYSSLIFFKDTSTSLPTLTTLIFPSSHTAHLPIYVPTSIFRGRIQKEASPQSIPQFPLSDNLNSQTVGCICQIASSHYMYLVLTPYIYSNLLKSHNFIHHTSHNKTHRYIIILTLFFDMKYFYHMPILLHGILGLQFIPTPSVNGN